MSQTVVGTLVVNLKGNTASFTYDLNQLPAKAKDSAKGIQDAFDGVNFGEARGGLMFLEESIGVRLPRHLNSLLATLPGVGAAMAMAFPILGAVVLVEKIVEAVTKFGEFKEKIHAAANAYEEFAQSTARHAQAIEIENLKLTDQLRILQGKVSVNGPAIAMEEARLKAEELTAQIQKAIAAEKDLLKKQETGFWKGLLGDTRTDDITKPIIDAKEAIGELERQRGIALQAQDKAAQESIEKELALKRTNLAIWIQNQQDVEDGARKAKLATIASDSAAALAARKKADPSHSASLDKPFADAATAQAEKLNAAYANRAELLRSAMLELHAESQEEADQLKNAQLHLAIDKERDALRNVVDMSKQTGGGKLGMQGSFDANGKYLDAEATRKQAADKLDFTAADALGKSHLFDLVELTKITDEYEKQQKLADQMTANASAATLADDIHKIKMQEASGIITKIQADQQIIVKITESEAKAEKDKNAELAKQLALITRLATLTNGGTTGSEADKKAYNKAIADYQAFLLTKEKAQATSIAKQNKAEEDAAARQTAERKRALSAMESALNSSVLSVIQGQNSIGDAAQKMWSGMASNAITAMLTMAEQELIGLALHQTVALTEKEINAKKAFGSAYAATADIPIVGPALAPVAGALAFAAVMAFERGGDVPDGHGGIPSILHPREMVLDSKLADVVRGAAANNGGGSNGNARNATYAPTINAGFASADEIDTKLKGHFDRWARGEARKRYTRIN